MSLRNYLIMAFLALIVIITVGLAAIGDHFMDRLTEGTLQVEDQALQEVTAANAHEAEEILTSYGEYVVKDKAEDVVRELTIFFAGKKNFDYAQLRRDPLLRKIAVQEIRTVQGVAGYTDLYDRHGYILFHPDKAVEGRNQLDWAEQYPETTELIKRSFSEDQVSGYYTFFDVHKRERKRYAYRLHIPGTPFIVGAIVNIDDFFLPTREKIINASQRAAAAARETIQEHHAVIDRRAKIGGLIAGLVFCLMGGVVGVWLATTIARPLRRLRDGVQEVGEGNFEVAVPVKGVREVVHLAHSFNYLGQQLTEYMEKRDFIRDTFGRYVTQDVVKRLLEDKGALELGGETREVSIIMSDLRGFTAIIAEMDPEQVIAFLNRYLGKMIAILLDHRAVIDEIVGDGILAFFGAPEPMEDHPARAVACALLMQAAMEEINALNAVDDFPHLEMGIGVNTGTVVVGNIGSERRTKYSVVGAHVNFASRMEGYALGGQVLISPSTYRRVRGLVDVREEIRVEMKGMPEAATLYDVRGIGGDYHLSLPERDDSLVLLPEQMEARIAGIREKIVAGTICAAWITHLGDAAAALTCEGKFDEWEDVRLTLLDKQSQEIPGHIYGKVTKVAPRGAGMFEVTVNFTSVAPEAYAIISAGVVRAREWRDAD